MIEITLPDEDPVRIYRWNEPDCDHDDCSHCLLDLAEPHEILGRLLGELILRSPTMGLFDATNHLAKILLANEDLAQKVLKLAEGPSKDREAPNEAPE